MMVSMSTNRQAGGSYYMVICILLLLSAVLIVGLGYFWINSGPGVASLVYEMRRVESTQDTPLLVTFHEVTTNGQVKLRCRIRNVSAEPVKLSYGALPWNSWMSYRIVALPTRGGRELILGPGAGSVLLPDSDQPEIIPLGGSLEGDIDLKFVDPYELLPANQEVLLLWSYGNGKYTGMTPFRKS
jgi:hypothetical protein